MDRLPVSPIVTRVIVLAAGKLGMEQLARRMNVPEALLMAWRDGQAAIPRGEFLRLVEILLDLDIGWDDWDKT